VGQCPTWWPPCQI